MPCVLLLCASLAFPQQPRPARLAADPVPPSVRAEAGGPDAASPSQDTARAPQDAAPVLQWEVINPFRFIRDQNSVDELRRVYEGLAQRSAYNLERKLQELSEAEVNRESEAEKVRLGCDGKRSDSARKKCLQKTKLPYPGWFARLAANNHDKTCWNSDTQQFRTEDGCRDYIHPKSHKVRMWINNLRLLGAGELRWFKDDRPLAEDEYKNCSARYPKGLCIEFDLQYDPSGNAAPISILVKSADGSLQIGPTPVRVKDDLIVGLGDSYAAGEGNPDIPAKFTKEKTDLDILFGIRVAPRKDDSKVGWLDRRCHRSMYSYQFKTALLYALANPHKAVTYVSYSCSGATTSNIIEEEQSPNEGRGKVRKQLEALRNVLGGGKAQTREIDYLLLSTGGNDIGFATYVAYVVLRGLPRKLFALGVNEEAFIEMTEKGQFKKTLLSRGGGNYYRLHSALLDEKKGVRIKGCKPGAPCERILLTLYPNIFNDETGQLCKVDRQEFNIPFGPSAARAARLKLVEDYVYNPLHAIQLSLKSDPEIVSNLGWTIVTNHLPEYLTHGFCAKKSDSQSTNSDRKSTGEEFVMPLRDDGAWEPFDPRDYKSYESRQRWVRLPVDSKLTTDQTHCFFNFCIEVALEDDASNIMHPTAEGLAVHADANVVEIERIEGRGDERLRPVQSTADKAGTLTRGQ